MVKGAKHLSLVPNHVGTQEYFKWSVNGLQKVNQFDYGIGSDAFFPLTFSQNTGTYYFFFSCWLIKIYCHILLLEALHIVYPSFGYACIFIFSD